jgi:hypothetical protein
VRQGGLITSDKQRVIVAEWADEKVRADSINRLIEMKDRTGIVLDMSSSTQFRHEEDTQIWGMFGDEPKVDEAFDENIARLCKIACAGASVFCPDGLGKAQKKELVSKGYTLVTNVTTIKDLLKSKGPVIVSDTFVEEVIGGTDVWNDFSALFEKAGKKINLLPPSATVDQVLGMVFGD